MLRGALRTDIGHEAELLHHPDRKEARGDLEGKGQAQQWLLVPKTTAGHSCHPLRSGFKSLLCAFLAMLVSPSGEQRMMAVNP